MERETNTSSLNLGEKNLLHNRQVWTNNSPNMCKEIVFHHRGQGIRFWDESAFCCCWGIYIRKIVPIFYSSRITTASYFSLSYFKRSLRRCCKYLPCSWWIDIDVSKQPQRLFNEYCNQHGQPIRNRGYVFCFKTVQLRTLVPSRVLLSKVQP